MVQIQSFIEQAWGHLRADRPKQAMDCAKKAHAISPNSPDVAHLLGLLASRDGHPQIALPLLQKAIDTGGKTSQRLRHMTEALLDAGYPQQALIPLQDALNEFGESSNLLGLKSAIEIALEQWAEAANTAQRAIELNPSLMAWELNLSFAQMMQGNIEDGFKNATARPRNLTASSLCPALHFSKPCTIWLKSEQGLGDTLFYLRYIAPLVEQGWQFHLEADRKLIPILQSSPLFLSVKEKNNCPKNEFSINLGDLPLVAYQTGIKEIPPPLPLAPDPKLVEKYQLELAKIGPAPYIGVTWRGGPKGQKQRAGIGLLEKVIDPTLLGQTLANTQATIISLQRLPDLEEAKSFEKALGRKPADYSALNNNLAGILAILSVVDEYITVSNTNLHLREGLAKTSHVFVNRPFQDWRWQADGKHSVWYPNSQISRQQPDKTWGDAWAQLSHAVANLSPNYSKNKSSQTKQQPNTKPASLSESTAVANNQQLNKQHMALINEGWAEVSHNIPQAIAKAREVLTQAPKNARAMHLLGWAAVQDLKFDLGLSVLAQATQLEHNNGNIWRDYIRTLVLVDKCAEAIQIGLNCLENPNLWGQGVVYFALGVACAELNDSAKALEYYEKCLSLIPTHIDAMSAAGMMRLKLNQNTLLGFKYSTNRHEARNPDFFKYWVCPALKGNVAGLKVLIIRTNGLGDELIYLRYLTYLLGAGVEVTYWSGAKLEPLLKRSYPSLNVIPDTESMPNPEEYDLAFFKDELPIAVEHLGAPEIADPLPIMLDKQKLAYWKERLAEHGSAPYIGVTWRAGVGGAVKDGFGFTRLSKNVEQAEFANALTGIKGTIFSLQRNITKDELNTFENLLGCPVIDIAGTTDDLDDLLCIQALLDENIGVSNTNMHLRASLGLGSRVLMNFRNADWRWSVINHEPIWFKKSMVYHQSEKDCWQATLVKLRDDLVEKYGLAEKQTHSLSPKHDIATVQAKKIVWVTAGEIKKGDDGYFSPLASAQERVVNVARLLEATGWQSVFLIESVSELMGGWHDKLPVKGDVVVFSKVFTEHAIKLMHDARARGASVVVDVFNDFESQPSRALHQQKMIQAADVVISSPELQLKWQRLNQAIAFYYDGINEDRTPQEIEQASQDWLAVLNNSNSAILQQKFTQNEDERTAADANKPASATTKRLVWLTGGDIQNHQGILSSDLASTRYRVISPAQALEKSGWKSQIINEAASKELGQWGIEQPRPGDTLIVSKVFTEHSLSLVYDAKRRGANIVVDLCDNHLNHPQRGALQKALLEMSDLIVTSTQALNEALAQLGKQADAVISDPVEFRRGEVKFSPNKVLKLVWFGHAVNIDTLIQTMPALANLAQTKPLQLNVVTILPNGQQDLAKIIPTGLSVTYTPWSSHATESAVAECDMVIIPTLQSDNKNAKSPNRLLESLWAGRMVVAGHLPAYLHFADSAWVGNNIIEGIQWCIANPEEVKARIEQGQSDIEKYFTQQAIGQQWHKVLSQTNAMSSNPQPKLPLKAESISPLEDYFQVAEVARIFATQETNASIITQQYYQHYPVKYKLDTPKTAVYTAIIGGYDTAPILNHIDPQLDYILYTDQADFNAPAPWQIRVVPAMFADPQMDARRIKVLSHLFLADYDIAVWIDGNFTLEKLNYALISEIASRAPIALCKHQFRNCIYDEAVEILKRGIDASTPVLRQIQYYQAHAFPRQHGLHATSFLVRNHLDPHTIKMNMRWWEILSTNSKRDQLSFDFVRWEQNAPVMTLPWNLRENTLYFWGKNGERKHQVDVRRNNEHEGRALNYQNAPALTPHAYQPMFDQWHAIFVQDLNRLNQVLISQTGIINNSVLYAQPLTCAQTLPDVRLGELQRNTLNKLTHAKRILQIGFDGGHLALMAIHHSGAKVVVVDDNLDSYKQLGLDYLSKTHSKRFARFSKQDIMQIDEALFDLIFINEYEPDQNKELINKLKQVNKTTNFAHFNYEATSTNFGIHSNYKNNQLARIDETKFTKSTYGVWLKNRKGDLTWKFAVQGKYGFFYADWLKKQGASIFIDIGANIGLYSLIASTNKNFQSIYSFEPHPETYEYLVNNIAVNSAYSCTPYKLAISNTCATQTIHVKPNHSGVATLRKVKPTEGYQSAIEIESVDAEVLNVLIKNPDNLPICIKIDVEGFELVVIETLRQTDFWPNVTNIFYEVDESYLDYEKVEEILISEGFIFEAKNGQDHHYDLLFTRQPAALS